MTKLSRFYFMLAGETFSSMVESHGLIKGKYYELLNEIEYDMDRCKVGAMDFDTCEGDAKTALIESGATFAIIFKGSKLFGVVTKNKTTTFEVIDDKGVL